MAQVLYNNQNIISGSTYIVSFKEEKFIVSDVNNNNNIDIDTLLSTIQINTNELQNRFLWDIMKDSNAGKNTIDNDNIEEVLKKCFPTFSLPEKPTWKNGLHNLDTKIVNSVTIREENIKMKTTTPIRAKRWSTTGML